jgi:trehalose 6-phosphate synthase
VNERDGVVVLSDNTGAYEELREFVVNVDPLDIAQQAAALDLALAYPDEGRRENARAIQAHVRKNDLSAWLVAQLADLDRVSAPA